MRRPAVRSLLAGLLLAAAASPLHAQSFFATGSEVWIRFLGSEAAYTSDLYFCTAPDIASCSTLVLRNKTATVGMEYLLPGTFSAGQEVVLGLNVVSTGNWFFSGPADRNVDGVVHVAATPLAGDARYTLQGGFEDIRGGGDRDYNDLELAFGGLSMSTVPEPASLVLVATGLFAIGSAAHRRRRRSPQG